MTQRLVYLVAHDWSRFDGYLASQKIDPLRLPMDRFLSLAYWWAVKDAADPNAVTKFDMRLWMPPKGVVPTQGPWTPEAETAAFQGFKRSVNAGTASSA